MRRSMNWLGLTTTIVLAVCVMGALPAGAQGRRAMAASGGQVNHLAPLENALQSAGATALTSDQETSITTLITNFRASQTPPAANSTVDAARTAYDNAILAGQGDTAQTQIPTIASGMAANATARLQQNAGFMISVIQVLGTEDQVNPLVTKFGVSRVVRLIEMLGGGPGFGSPGGRGQGPMGMRRPGSQ